jgi:hypothetical protein
MWPTRDDSTRAARLYVPKDGSKKEETTMADPRKKKRNPAAVNAIPQHEVKARLLREKAARLKELRLAHEATKASSYVAKDALVWRSTCRGN